FGNLVLIPMGADKVFVRSSEGVDALPIVKGAKEFFSLIFSNWVRWGEDVTPYRRGAWVRLYGVPLHAWNVDFFKLCVFECGSFLRADSCSADRDRLDFARVLIATPDLEIIKRVATVLVDGTLVEVKIMEEWGYAMGEDICLFEEECGSEAPQSDFGEGYVDPEVRRNVDVMVERFVEGLEKEVGKDYQDQSGAEKAGKPDDNQSFEGETEKEA
ncbi:sulfate transporter, partial [Trifolium medium]|nr:sulfate transporter [Trifolium medium]